VGLASGILAGLVAITPAAGDVRPAGALALGALGAVVSFGALRLKGRLGYDDTLDVFGIHGVAGVVGALGLTFFLRTPTAAGLWGQLWNQAVGVGVAALWGGLGTLSLLWLTERLVGLRLPAAEEARGMDLSLHGEVGYGLARPEEM